MDPRFTTFMIEQLTALLRELKSAEEPSNTRLCEAITPVLRDQYNTKQKLPF